MTRAYGELAALADTDLVAAAAWASIEDAVLGDPVDGDLDALMWASESLRWDTPAIRLTDAHTAVNELAFLAALPWHVAIESMSIAGGQQAAPFPPGVAEFAAAKAAAAEAEGLGWMDPDAERVLHSSDWFLVDHAAELMPDAVAEIEAAVVGSDLLVVDTWLLDGADATEPIDLESVEAATIELATVVEPIVGEAVAEELRAIDRAADDGERDDLVLVALAGGAVALSVLALVVGVWTVVRAQRWSHRRAALASRDPLTGVGNRYELDDGPARFLADRRFADHLLVVIDLDRFKLINDAHGHAAGDAVLVEVARRLEAAARVVAGMHDDAEWRVVRLGGDEFLMTIHARTTIDLPRLRRLLDHARDTPFDAGEHRLIPGFSIGIAHQDGTGDLETLMRAADLAAYDDKAHRSDGSIGRAAAVTPGSATESATSRTL